MSFILSQGASAVRAQGSGSLNLARDGKTAYVIALPATAIPSEKTAALQLQKYLQEVTKASFPIRVETEVKAAAPQILVGVGKRVKNILPKQDWNSLGSDGVVIQTVGRNLILAGGRPRGSLYAVFEFLERAVGCRWWTPTENTIPHKANLNIPRQNMVYTPVFSYRDNYTSAVRSNPFFAVTTRQNGVNINLDANLGGNYKILGGSHTFSVLLPPETYFKDHPEWYSDPLNGNKPCTKESTMPAGQGTQLCLSNPEVVDELTKQALIWIEKEPNAGYISISQNDNGNFCQDEASVALAAQEGSLSGPLLKFVNQVADRIYEKHPNFKVLTLAYGPTINPPKTIRPAKNVLIQFADINIDYGHPVDSEWNQKPRDNLLAWSKMTSQIYVWNYVTNFYNMLMPHPNWDGLAKDLRFFAAHNVTSIFQQGDAQTNGVGDFTQLRTWLIGKLLWNPNQDQARLTDEFLKGYYGAAAPYLKEYLNLVEQTFKSQKRGLTTFNGDFSFLTLDVANKATQLFDQAALAVKNNETLLQRVRRERLSLEMAVLTHYKILQRTASRENKEFLGPKDPKVAMAEFIEVAQKFGIQDYREGISFASQIPRLQSMFTAPVALPDFAQKYPSHDVVDIQIADYNLFLLGTLTGMVQDPNASDGTAAMMVSDTNEWAITVRLGQDLGATTEKWHAYALVRNEAKDGSTPAGLAFQSGIYDETNSKAVVSGVPVEAVQGEGYTTIDLGTHSINGGMYFWFQPVRNPTLKRIYVDRIILVHEDEKKQE
jgi:hypothetical protein